MTRLEVALVIVLAVGAVLGTLECSSTNDKHLDEKARATEITEFERSLRRAALDKCVGDGGYPINVGGDVVCLRREAVLWAKDVSFKR